MSLAALALQARISLPSAAALCLWLHCCRLSAFLAPRMEEAAASFVRDQQAWVQQLGLHSEKLPWSQLRPQLQQLWVHGNHISFRLGVSGLIAAAFASSCLPHAEYQVDLAQQLPHVGQPGLMTPTTAEPAEDCSPSWQLPQQCVSALLQHERRAATGTSMADELFGVSGCCRPVRTLHAVTPVWGQASTQQQSAFTSSDSSNSSRKPAVRQQAAATAVATVTAQQPSRELSGLLYEVGRPQPGIANVLGDVLQRVAYQALVSGPLRAHAQQCGPQHDQRWQCMSSGLTSQAEAASPGRWGSTVDRKQQQQQQQGMPEQVSDLQDNSKPSGTASIGSHQSNTASSLAGWCMGLPPVHCDTTAAAAAGGEAVLPSGRVLPGALVLLLGPPHSGKSSMLRDIARNVFGAGVIGKVAVVDLHSKLAGRAVPPGSR